MRTFSDILLAEIAREFEGIARDDLTTLEDNVFKRLKDSDFLKLDTYQEVRLTDNAKEFLKKQT